MGFDAKKFYQQRCCRLLNETKHGHKDFYC